MHDPVIEVERYLAGPPKVSQTDFGKAIGASQSTVSRILSRDVCPTLAQAAKIQDVAGVPIGAWSKVAKRLATKREGRAA